MYQLFELSKVLTLLSPGRKDTDVTIELSAYAEIEDKSLLILICSNDYLLFCYTWVGHKPQVQQLAWFHDREKKVKAVSFDSSGSWLMLITADNTLYILPILHLLDFDAHVHYYWKTDDLTEIKTTQKFLPSALRWWQTTHNQHVAVIGNENGDILFVNLLTKKEVGGTSIPAGIAVSSLDLLHDDSHDTTYLLITGNNSQQWRLLLEEKTEICWPLDIEVEMIVNDDEEIQGGQDDSTVNDQKPHTSRPHHLSKFESGTFLTPHQGSGHNLLSAYNAASNMLQVLEGSIDQMHLYSYLVPPICEKIVLTDKLIFISQSEESANTDSVYKLKVLSRKFAEVPTESSKKPKGVFDAEVQHFVVNSKIQALYRRSHSNFAKKGERKKSSSLLQQKQLRNMPKFVSFSKGSKSHLSKDEFNKTELINSAIKETDIIQKCSPRKKDNLEESKMKKFHLDGCLVVFNNAVWECRPRIAPEKLFLSLTSLPNTLPEAEKLSIMLGLDMQKLYEIAADLQLSSGQFAQAVHLYQLSKCPQLKRVAHFMGYGYLSELIAYIQVLFSTKSVEIAMPDKGHFANIALHCFTQQILEKQLERTAITQALRKFLKENLFFDEEFSIRLLAEQGLYDLLYYCVQMRGQQGLMVETLLSLDGIRESVDQSTHDCLMKSGYEAVLLCNDNDNYLQCITSPQLLQFLASKPCLLSNHLQYVVQLLPNLNTSHLLNLAMLYDPSQRVAKLVLKNIATSHQRRRYWSITSLTSISSDVLDFVHSDDHSANEEDILKFFIFVLLMLINKTGKAQFNKKLIKFDSENYSSPSSQIVDTDTDIKNFELIQLPPIACGSAHVAFIRSGTLHTWGKASGGRLGHGDINLEYLIPSPVDLLLNLQIKVTAVSCGALHTLAVSECGLFGWGSSFYGQVGVENLQRCCHPVLIETLMKETIVDVECGQYHSLALTKEGKVYSWGWGIHGQLGHSSPEDLCTPKMIKFFKSRPVLSISAGQGHTAVLTRNGLVYTFGCGMFGQLGLGTVIKYTSPQHVELPEHIKLLASGYFHVVAVSKTNKIYSWGCNPQALRIQAQSSRRARLHNSSQSQDSNSAANKSSHTSRSNQQAPITQQSHLVPILVDSSAISVAIIQLSCGSHHSAVVTSNGEIFTWGRNMEGQLGNGTRKEQKIPSSVVSLNDKKIISLACGADFTVALDSIGRLWGWGQNDVGQIGQKPALESKSVPMWGSSSGRVITIRTNRRMITITQPCHQGILCPVEITIPIESKQIPLDLDSSSFESSHSHLQKFLFYRTFGDKDYFPSELSTLDDPPYGPFALHASLKAFHSLCDAASLLSHCLNFENYQAAAKLCALEGLYAQAVEYQLKALDSVYLSPPTDCLNNALEAITYYSKMIQPDNTDSNKQFLKHIISFWMKHHLSVEPLEAFLSNYLNQFSYPLGILLFCDEPNDFTHLVHQKFVLQLSTNFCLTLAMSIIEEATSNKNYTELMEKITNITGTASLLRHIHAADGFTGWDESVQPQRLWDEIFHTLQKSTVSHASLHLTASDVDLLTKSLMGEKLYGQIYTLPAKSEKFEESENEVVLFTCGHYYTMNMFKTSVLPSFKDSLLKLSHSLPQTTKLLLSIYQPQGLISAACPTCVLREIRSEL